jgi:apolipoprotein N-acyltransferase
VAILAVGRNGAPAVEVARGPRSWQRLALAVASGLILAPAFPPFDLEFLAWIGLVPLFAAAHDLSPRAAFGVGWVGGAVFFLAIVYWITYTISAYSAVPAPVAVLILLLLVAVLACYVGGFMAAVAWVDRRGLSVVWLAPALWVAIEWLRSWFPIGFPWASLGYSQYRYHDLVQVAEVTGVYGVSAILVLFNVVVFAVLRERGPGLRRLIPALGLLTLCVTLLPLWGRARAAELVGRSAGRLRVAIVQGNVEQDQKWDPAYQAGTVEKYRDLTRMVLVEHPDIVVWPETATPFFFQEPGDLRLGLLDLVRESHVHLLFGSPAYHQSSRGELQELNRAYFVSPEGRELDVYDKIQLVPFGEYVPFQSLFFFVQRLVVAIGDVVPGARTTVFQHPAGRFGVVICYEDIFPALTRRFVAAGADFLVNITNDAWFGRTSAPYQHLAQATLRSVENRVPLVRVANTGISAVIEADGRIRWHGPLFETAIHTETIAWPGVLTFYARYGDVFAWACVLASLAAFGYGARRWHGTRARPT